jgi:hypothetical protein
MICELGLPGDPQRLDRGNREIAAPRPPHACQTSRRHEAYGAAMPGLLSPPTSQLPPISPRCPNPPWRDRRARFLGNPAGSKGSPNRSPCLAGLPRRPANRRARSRGDPRRRAGIRDVHLLVQTARRRIICAHRHPTDGAAPCSGPHRGPGGAEYYVGPVSCGGFRSHFSSVAGQILPAQSANDQPYDAVHGPRPCAPRCSLRPCRTRWPAHRTLRAA